MKNKLSKEGWGLRIEVAGLAVVILAAGLQFVLLDWFAKNDRAAISMAQTSVNQAVLRSLQEMGDLLDTTDAEQKRHAHANIDQLATWALKDSAELDASRKRLANGQAGTTKNVYVALYVLGALLILLGKSLIAEHKIASSTPKDVGHDATPAEP
ncbi:hypothetical protein [Roseateles sp. LKC17W]|uniref:Methyl-accepting chemotaxis protein n=1 Tax=Pelomonas margarita TaxID=3299031 RepID=A0ABW7FFK1_9BURK